MAAVLNQLRPWRYLLDVTDRSMDRADHPRFPPGCVIEVDRHAPVQAGSFVVARVPHLDTWIFRRFHRDACGGAWLLPLNPQWPPIPADGMIDAHLVVSVSNLAIDEHGREA